MRFIVHNGDLHRIEKRPGPGTEKLPCADDARSVHERVDPLERDTQVGKLHERGGFDLSPERKFRVDPLKHPGAPDRGELRLHVRRSALIPLDGDETRSQAPRLPNECLRQEPGICIRRGKNGERPEPPLLDRVAGHRAPAGVVIRVGLEHVPPYRRDPVRIRRRSHQGQPPRICHRGGGSHLR